MSTKIRIGILFFGVLLITAVLLTFGSMGDALAGEDIPPTTFWPSMTPPPTKQSTETATSEIPPTTFWPSMTPPPTKQPTETATSDIPPTTFWPSMTPPPTKEPTGTPPPTGTAVFIFIPYAEK